MKIFYHNDMDGKCAAHIILHYTEENEENEGDIITYPINYGMEFPFSEIGEDELVFILDYSIEPEEMTKLLGITQGVVWIDHHKSAIQKYADYPVEIMGLRQVSDKPDDFPPPMAGCELTYRWIWWHEPENTPEYIRLIGDRDAWTWKYGDRTKHFFAGLESYDTDPRADIWTALAKDASGYELASITTDGKTIQRYKDITQQEYIRENAFPVDFAGYKCVAANGLYSSQPFQAVFPDADIWIPFRYMKEGYWTVSLYTNKDIDVSEIAKQYVYQGKRGGGHKKAAGFQCAYPPLLDEALDEIKAAEWGKGYREGMAGVDI